MNKHAFIITNEGTRNTKDFLPGVEVDKRNIRNYLKSPLGGGWLDIEISDLNSSNTYCISEKLKNFKYYDFLLIFFSGHGSHDGRYTRLWLSDTDFFTDDILRDYGKKRLIILDCCRKIERSMLNEDMMHFIQKSAGLELNFSACRELYEKHIVNLISSETICYSCSIDETSADLDNKGGLYISSLLDSATDKHKEHHVFNSAVAKVYSINEIHQIAKEKVKRSSMNKQNPIMHRERLSNDFPFAVIAL